MTWKPPSTEIEWEECLSAYADGELDSDSTAALEAHLQQDAIRAEQLEALRKTSSILQAWTVDAPPPSLALQTARAKQRSGLEKSTRTAFSLRNVARLAAAFAMGVLAGGWMMNPNRATAPSTSAEQIAKQVETPIAPSTVSQAQADVIFKEVEAAALTQRIEQAARDGQWKRAVEGLERMQTHYAGTEAAHALAKAPMVRRIAQRSLRGRS